jgi:hypothetical protein
VSDRADSALEGLRSGLADGRRRVVGPKLGGACLGVHGSPSYGNQGGSGAVGDHEAHEVTKLTGRLGVQRSWRPVSFGNCRAADQRGLDVTPSCHRGRRDRQDAGEAVAWPSRTVSAFSVLEVATGTEPLDVPATSGACPSPSRCRARPRRRTHRGRPSWWKAPRRRYCMRGQSPRRTAPAQGLGRAVPHLEASTTIVGGRAPASTATTPWSATSTLWRP